MAPSPKHLVILGCGYIGSAVAREALTRGYRVTAVTRNISHAAELRRLGAAVVVSDLAGKEWHEQVRSSADLILNTVSSGGGDLAAYRHSYVEGMQSIVQWAVRHGGAEVGVYTSSTSVYPQGGGVVVTEDSPTDPAGERAQVLLEAEAVLMRGAVAAAPGTGATAEAGSGRRGYARAVVLRLAGIYGPGRHHLLDQVKAGVVSGRGNHRLNLVHRDDVCGAIWAAFAYGLNGPDAIFNLADDEPAEKSVVTAWLATRLGVPPPTFTGEPAGPRRRLTPDRIISNARFKTATGWTPRFANYQRGYENILSRSAD